jgi:hypothetical protein
MFQDLFFRNYLARLVQAREIMLNGILVRMAVAGNDDEAMSEIESACKRTTGLFLDVVRRTAPERLEELIHCGQTDFRSILLAKLLIKDAELNEKLGKEPSAIVSRLQAYCLICDSLKFLGPEEQAEYQKKLNVLAAALQAKCDDPYVRGIIESRHEIPSIA